MKRGVSAWIKVTGYAPSGSMQTGVLCMLEKSKIANASRAIIGNALRRPATLCANAT